MAILGTRGDNRHRGVDRLAERTIGDIEVPLVDDALVWEHHTQRDNRQGYQRFVRGRVDYVVFAVSGSAMGTGWAWGDLVSVASAQAEKIRSLIDDQSGLGR